MIRSAKNLLAAFALATLGAGLAATPALAVNSAPAWYIQSVASPTNFVPGLTNGTDLYTINAVNVGGAPTDGSTVTVTVDLPPGFIAQPNTAFPGQLYPSIFDNFQGTPTPCTDLGPPVVCRLDHTLVPGESIAVQIPVQAPSSGPPTVANQVTVSGGGAVPATVSEVTPFTPDPAPFGIQRLGTSFTDVDGSPVSKAGAHPFSFRFGFNVNSNHLGITNIVPAETPRNVSADLFPGFVANPTAIPKCTEAQFETIDNFGRVGCPDDSAVGVAQYAADVFGYPTSSLQDSVYNMVPPPGSPGAFAFDPVSLNIFIHILGAVDPARNYALSGKVYDITEFGFLTGTTIDFWEDPSDPAHDGMRGLCGSSNDYTNHCFVPPDPTPFLTMPTACSDELEASFTAISWQNKNPGMPVTASATTTDTAGNPVGITGCGSLDFQPTLKARPTTNVADSPSGLEVDLHVPQSDSHDTLATAHLKEAVVTLPEGITINPSAGNGLAACSSAEVGIDPDSGVPNGDRPKCPDASKIGTVNVISPLVDDALPGAVYIAAPHDNPFDSFLAIYIVVDDPQSGVVVKLPGHVVADPVTGQLTATFEENPQLPFEDFKLDFFGGAGGTLRTPELCGSYSTTSELTPWTAPDSGPPATPHDDYAITQGPSGPCPTSESAKPNAPSFDAGSVSPIAGLHTPFVMHLRRADATQQFSAVSVSPPPGLVAKLTGTTICPQAALDAAASKSGTQEKASPSCPASSAVGSVVAGAGAGPAPYHAQGKVYVSGPYKGAPLSLAIITPATAGPFDLGTVVTRTAIYVDPKTAKITAVSDPLPRILEGIPLDIRTVDLALDRPDFTLNGTSCDPSSVDGQLTTTLGQVAPLFSRFQLGDCTALGFKPKLTLRLKGGTTRGKHPALTAILEPRAGDANISFASVALPHSEFLDQGHIGTVCTRVQFAADQCPAASVYGTATVTTPLFDYPLIGNVYLRSSDNVLPDLVPDLRGPSYQPLRIEASGRTDSVKGGLRNTFDFVPDAPFTKFVLQLQGGKKGLLQNSTNICKEPNRATVKYSAHNGDAYEIRPVLKVKCGKKARKGHKRHGQRRAHRG